MATHRNTWKAAERRVAAAFGVLRNRLSGSSGRRDESAADIKHPKLFIENKYRDANAIRTLFDKVKVKAKREGKIPIITLVDKRKHGFMVCFHFDDVDRLADESVYVIPDDFLGFDDDEPC